MRKRPIGKWGKVFLAVVFLIITAGILGWVFLLPPAFQARLEWEWGFFFRESARVLGFKIKENIPPEEKRIREDVILKKMEEAATGQDWKSLTREYPKLKKVEAQTEEERMKVLKESSEFDELKGKVEEYLRKKEDQFLPEPPVPSVKEGMEVARLRDKGSEKIIEKLLSRKERSLLEKPLEINLQLGMKGPLAARKIVERPSPPQVKVRVEAEVEMTLWVLPNGLVDRVLPSIKGDSELERLATQYLKQWRFLPLPKDQPQVEQWGTIPIKFRLQ